MGPISFRKKNVVPHNDDMQTGQENKGRDQNGPIFDATQSPNLPNICSFPKQ
jgi:hypothetical protein